MPAIDGSGQPSVSVWLLVSNVRPPREQVRERSCLALRGGHRQWGVPKRVFGFQIELMPLEIQHCAVVRHVF